MRHPDNEWALNALSTLPGMRRDLLTGLANRRFFNRRGAAIFAKLKPSDRVCSILCISLGPWAQLVQRAGRRGAVSSICQCAEVIRATLRPGDLLARTTRTEFCLLLPDEVEADMRSLGQRLAGKIDEALSGKGLNASVRVTVLTLEPAKIGFQQAMQMLASQQPLSN